MATYLLTKNAERWKWKNLNECISEINEHGYYESRWSCGVTKKILPGDRIFLIKQEAEPRGIIASGWAISKVYEDLYWNKQKSIKGNNALYINVRFETILNPKEQIFHRDKLNKGIYLKMNWGTQASDITIPDDVASNYK